MTTSFKDILEQTQNREKIRVWSLIITFFGDAIVPRGGAVSAQTVQSLMKQFLIDPGAVRTALSRLTQDGWVIREKRGRNSFYRLSEEGYEPFARASARIYAPPNLHINQNKIVLAIAPDTLPENRSQKTQFISPRIELYNEFDPTIEERKIEGWFVLEAQAQSVPSWVHKELLSDELAVGFTELTKQFEAASVGTPLEALALRTLLIHEWRRLLLRSTIVPNVISPDDWPVKLCRRQVVKTYRDCLNRSEDWLSKHGEGPDGALPPPKGLYQRFEDN